MIEFKLFGIRIGFDFSFFAVLLIFSLMDEGAFGLMGLSACMLHEGGHLLAMAAVGEKPSAVIFYGAGIKIINPNEYKLSFFKETIILISGCAVNFLLFTVFYFNGAHPVFAVIHLLIGIFNLLPVCNFDGGRLLTLGFSKIFSPDKAIYFSRCISLGFTLLALMTSIALYSLDIVNFTAVITLCYITVITMIFY